MRIRQADILLNSDPGSFAAALEGGTLREITRRGKWPLLHVGPRWVVEVQLRMTGRFVVHEVRPDPEIFGHLAAELRLDDGRSLWYDDRRRLGGFNLWTPEQWQERSAGLGPEPLDGELSVEYLRRSFRGRRAPVKNLLMNSRLVAGVGNVYAAEALHRSSLDPRRPGSGLASEEVGRLRRALIEVLQEGMAHGGTSFSDFRGPGGEAGRHQEHLAVYGREGDACPRCGGVVRRIKQAGRSTYFCPGCQR